MKKIASAKVGSGGATVIDIAIPDDSETSSQDVRWVILASLKSNENVTAGDLFLSSGTTTTGRFKGFSGWDGSVATINFGGATASTFVITDGIGAAASNTGGFSNIEFWSRGVTTGVGSSTGGGFPSSSRQYYYTPMLFSGGNTTRLYLSAGNSFVENSTVDVYKISPLNS